METQSQPPVDVTQVTGARVLHFELLSDALEEAAALVEQAGTVRPLGNLSLGQALKHIALTLHGSVDGFGFSVPPEVQAFGRAHKAQVIAGRMRPGTQLPPAGNARFIPADCTPEEGLAALRTAVARLEKETPHQEHPYLGELEPDEWHSVLCRHAELHLGFMLVE